MKSATVRQDGYTIVEVMIFLTISAVLLVSAIGLLGGRISGTQFNQSVQALDSKIRTVANEAATGTYPSTPDFDCTVPATEPQITPLTSNKQGTRSDCVFAGKVINFGVTSSGCSLPVDSAKCESADVYTVVGRRVLADKKTVVTGLTGANGASPRIVTTPNITEVYPFGYSTRVSGIYRVKSGVLTQVSGLGFFQGFNASYGSNGDLNSGAHGVETWTVRNQTAIGISPLTIDQMAAAVKAETIDAPEPDSQVLVCLKNGSRKASITISSGNSGSIGTVVNIGDPLCP
ncbi:MAG: prepilin-type N-terminal cleavage/methylation domain-containing protein [Candidatus Saccharimonadales bacterium]